MSLQKNSMDMRREYNSTGKKSLCGKLVRVSELKASRVSGFEDSD